MKKHKGKWKNKGINKQERNKIYSKLRGKAKTILKNRHRKEYLNILKGLLKSRYNKLKYED